MVTTVELVSKWSPPKLLFTENALPGNHFCLYSCFLVFMNRSEARVVSGAYRKPMVEILGVERQREQHQHPSSKLYNKPLQTQVIAMVVDRRLDNILRTLLQPGQGDPGNADASRFANPFRLLNANYKANHDIVSMLRQLPYSQL